MACLIFDFGTFKKRLRMFTCGIFFQTRKSKFLSRQSILNNFYPRCGKWGGYRSSAAAAVNCLMLWRGCDFADADCLYNCVMFGILGTVQGWINETGWAVGGLLSVGLFFFF